MHIILICIIWLHIPINCTALRDPPTPVPVMSLAEAGGALFGPHPRWVQAHCKVHRPLLCANLDKTCLILKCYCLKSGRLPLKCEKPRRLLLQRKQHDWAEQMEVWASTWGWMATCCHPCVISRPLRHGSWFGGAQGIKQLLLEQGSSARPVTSLLTFGMEQGGWALFLFCLEHIKDRRDVDLEKIRSAWIRAAVVSCDL